MHVKKLIHRKYVEALKAEWIERKFGYGLFTDWRNKYIADLCRHIRLCWEAKNAGLKISEVYPSPEWCNAAVLILTHADPETQDYFLRSDLDAKDEFVEAVLQDRGIERFDGFFVQLPPL